MKKINGFASLLAIALVASSVACSGEAPESEAAEGALSQGEAVGGTYELYAGGNRHMGIYAEFGDDGETTSYGTYLPYQSNHVGTFRVATSGAFTFEAAPTYRGAIPAGLAAKSGKVASSDKEPTAETASLRLNDHSNQGYLQVVGGRFIAERVKTSKDKPLYARRCLALTVPNTIYEEGFTEYEYPDVDLDQDPTTGKMYLTNIGSAGQEGFMSGQPQANGDLSATIGEKDDYKLRFDIQGGSGKIWLVDDPSKPDLVATLECADPAKAAPEPAAARRETPNGRLKSRAEVLDQEWLDQNIMTGIARIETGQLDAELTPSNLSRLAATRASERLAQDDMRLDGEITLHTPKLSDAYLKELAKTIGVKGFVYDSSNPDNFTTLEANIAELVKLLGDMSSIDVLSLSSTIPGQPQAEDEAVYWVFVNRNTKSYVAFYVREGTV